ncbi:unnamed protein product [Rhizoctonia solani]|uniref:Uncharacterized protein n=1 Tax=Rhizoctonia solani TaxID=456999 RepID=A0A8H2WB32_9AGAM|nr:unnamed protein product [Rhizoctonia solani]
MNNTSFQLVTLKFTLTDSTSGYALFRRTLPKFLQLAAADSSLLTEQPDGSLIISFPRVLGSRLPEIKRFAIYDAMSAFLLGVPPLAEYGYDCECDSERHGFEWAYGIPVTLLQIISQVNSWRAGSRVTLDDWKTLEMHVLTWKLPCVMLEQASTPENVNVARAAVQEGWRHVLLIYVYMGVCGVSSHDSRAQTSVDRIFQLGEIVGSSHIGVHMLAHCVAAGLAARLEKHRIAVYEKLVSFRNTRNWIFSGSQFSEILYHLWHGNGAGGAAVTWDDYIRSRRAVVSI